MNKFLTSIESHFANNYQLKQIRPLESSVSSSVSIIIRKLSDYEILFIKRTKRESDKFSGHMAFPGGVKEVFDEDILSTAIRETSEEVGLDIKKNCNFIGRFSDYKPVNPNANQFIVSPFIFFLNEPEITLKKNVDEVEDFVWIPIQVLLELSTKSSRVTKKYNKTYKDNVFEYKGYTIWGMTGKILSSFLKEIETYF
jgi:8-oxo-dGTP pyrophosphatase MutT (NUDIX family)